MTKAELQSAVAAAAQTDKKTAGVFLDTLSAIAYKATKKNGEFVVPGFGKLVKQKRKARTGEVAKPTTCFSRESRVEAQGHFALWRVAKGQGFTRAPKGRQARLIPDLE
jgi:DNA-binding protein HU-beta